MYSFKILEVKIFIFVEILLDNLQVNEIKIL